MYPSKDPSDYTKKLRHGGCFFKDLEQVHESIFRGLRLPYNHRHMIFVL